MDQALCFGWIDGVRKSLDADSYAIRFTPRRLNSHWSLVNVQRVQELTRLGLMHPSGVRAFEARSEAKTGLGSYEQKEEPRLLPAQERRFRSNRAAWRWFQAQPPWYRRAAIHWISSAKREETQMRRLHALIEDCERGRPVGPLRRPNSS